MAEEFGSKEAGSKGGKARAARLSPEEKKRIASMGASARWNPIRSNQLSVSKLPSNAPSNPIGPNRQLPLFVDKEKEIDGVGMGVLSDGTAFLTGRGLARLCDVSNPRIVEMGQNWKLDAPNPLTKGVRKILQEKGMLPESPYIAIEQRSGMFYAYPDYVCLAVLEYYSFEQPMEYAIKNFRLLAGKALHDFIYTQVGYDPRNLVPEPWRQFHDRVSLTYNSVPVGYFSVFKEMADMIVHLGQAGLTIDSKFVPDISVGRCWAGHWRDQNLESQFGPRVTFDHNYPHYFPQSESNPQEAWCYPEMALGEFKRWVREGYIKTGKFKTYLDNQVKQRALPPSFAQLAVAAYTGTAAPGIERADA